MFLCIFTPVILAKANILWNPMDPAWINQSAVIGYTIGSVGMIAPVLALLIDRTNLTVNVFVIVGLSIVESILGFFPLGFFVLLARVVAMGIYVPYTLGFAASFIFVRKVGLFSGTIFFCDWDHFCSVMCSGFYNFETNCINQRRKSGEGNCTAGCCGVDGGLPITRLYCRKTHKVRSFQCVNLGLCK